VMYLADQKGGEKIAPIAGTPERYKMQEWLVFIAPESPKNFRPLFRKTPDPMHPGILTKRLHLGAGTPAEQPSLRRQPGWAARSSLCPAPGWAARAGPPLPQPLQQFMERVKARPAVAKTLEIEGLT